VQKELRLIELLIVAVVVGALVVHHDATRPAGAPSTAAAAP
jgi:hypothetical protein